MAEVVSHPQSCCPKGTRRGKVWYVGDSPIYEPPRGSRCCMIYRIAGCAHLPESLKRLVSMILCPGQISLIRHQSNSGSRASPYS